MGIVNILQYTVDELRKLQLPAGRTTGLVAIESAFGFPVPPDAQEIGAVLGSGVLNDFEQFDAPRVIAETERLRASGGSPAKVVVGKLEGHLIAYDLGMAEPMLKTIEGEELAAFTYTGLILEQIERLRYRDVRAAVEKQHSDLTKKAAKQWRHRWGRDELANIERELERGKQLPDGIPADDEDEAASEPLRDLRGIVKPPKGYWQTGEPRTTIARLERIDFSFCEWFFEGVDARDCVFRGASFGTRESRFERCDFTMIDCSSRSKFLQDQLGTEFIDCDFTGAILAECSLNGTFTRCNFTAANLWWAQAEDMPFIDCTFAHTRFGGDARHWDERRTPW
jgi:uncharacterized protein YjbI with pentapeptide repeats